MSIASWVNSGMIHIGLKDLIEVEHEYPGLLKDVDALIWQIQLIKQQTKAEEG